MVTCEILLLHHVFVETDAAVSKLMLGSPLKSDVVQFIGSREQKLEGRMDGRTSRFGIALSLAWMPKTGGPISVATQGSRASSTDHHPVQFLDDP